MDYKAILASIQALITILGDVTLGEAKTWAEVKANAERLREEGHEDDSSEVEDSAPKPVGFE